MRAGIVIACLLVLALPSSAYAETLMTPGEAVRSASGIDESSITLSGEAIGESLRADSTHRWVNVLGDGVALGVYMSAEDAESISRYGDHTGSGDTIVVRGEFNRACVEHAGEMDLHAESVSITAQGIPAENVPDTWKGILGVALLGVALGEYRLFRYLRERRS